MDAGDLQSLDLHLGELLARVERDLLRLAGGRCLPSPLAAADIETARRWLKAELGTSPDLVLRELAVPATSPATVLIAYLDGLVNTVILDENVVEPLLAATTHPDTWGSTVLQAGNVEARREWHSVIQDLVLGNTLVFAPGSTVVWSVDTIQYKERSIARPDTELSVRGSDEAFNEVLATQMAQLRRRFHTPALRFVVVTVGAEATQVALAYLADVANPSLVTSVLQRLRSLPRDMVVHSAGTVGGAIRDHRLSIFPTLRNTERVDIAAWRLAEGRVLVLVDGDPFALIMPAPLLDFYRTAMDYGGTWYDASFVRGIRFAGWVLGVYLPALFIALTQMNLNVLPPGLLILVSGSRVGLPVTPLVEVVTMVFVIEILREAALRLPKNLGPTIGTVGAIVVGTAVVRAGVVSPQIIVLITLTALAFYSAPVYDLTGTWRLVNFAMLVSAGLLGLTGIVLTTLLLVGELTRLSSFGTPYFEPWAPFRLRDWMDAVVRLPWALLHQRPTAERPRRPEWAPPPPPVPVDLRGARGGNP
jgi:spore germination protein KA